MALQGGGVLRNCLNVKVYDTPSSKPITSNSDGEREREREREREKKKRERERERERKRKRKRERDRKMMKDVCVCIYIYTYRWASSMLECGWCLCTIAVIPRACYRSLDNRAAIYP